MGQFEIGIYQEDPSWSNYLGGVLEGEIGGSVETPLREHGNPNWPEPFLLRQGR